jgi:hypothetical protein
MQEIQQNDRDE